MMNLAAGSSSRRFTTVLTGVCVSLLCAATFTSSAQAISRILGTTGTHPVAITVDSHGNIYTANYGSNNVTKITPGGFYTTNWAATSSGPGAITVDSAGNIYTANAGSDNVTKITPGGFSTTNWVPAGLKPRAITLDSAGNIYTANFGSNDVSKITPGPFTNSSWAATGSNPYAITVDSAGNIYTANYGSDNVSKITPGGVSTTNWVATGSNTAAITVDSAGNIYTANINSSNVSKITPTVTNGLPDIFPAPPEKPSAPTAAAGSPGSGAATVSVTANPISAAFGTPSSYAIRATQDASKGCVVTSPSASCSVTGLTIGTAYTFTARANLNSWQTAASGASNSVTPAPKPAKPSVRWSSSAKRKTVTALITPVAGVTYTLTAKSGGKTKKGSCKNITITLGKKRVARRSCKIKLAKGKWLAAVTPKKGAAKGAANTKSYTFK